MKKFRALELIAKKYLDGFPSGLHPTLLKDNTIEVDAVRDYQPGDKRLDSKSSLRTGKTMSRFFNPERSLNLFIILDLSASQYTKLEGAVTAALYLCYLGDICNERIGLCLFDNKVKILDIMDDYSYIISSIEKAVSQVEMGLIADVGTAIDKVNNLFLTNSLVVLISDFCYPLTNNIISGLRKIALTPTNSLLSVVIYNPDDWMLGLDTTFKVKFKDAESGMVRDCELSSAEKQFCRWQDSVKTGLVRASSECVFLSTQDKQFLLPLIKNLMRS